MEGNGGDAEAGGVKDEEAEDLVIAKAMNGAEWAILLSNFWFLIRFLLAYQNVKFKNQGMFTFGNFQKYLNQKNSYVELDSPFWSCHSYNLPFLGYK